MHTYSRVLSSIRLALLPMICTLVLSVMPASDHFLGGKFPHTPGSWLNIGYTHQGAYSTTVVNAAKSWDATPTKLVVFPESIANSEVDFVVQYDAAAWWSLAVYHPCAGSGCSYQWVDVYLNSRTLASQSEFIRQKEAARQFGHAFGLKSHNSSYISVMGTSNVNTPQRHDVSDINTLYP